MLEIKVVGGQGFGSGKARAALGHVVVGPGKPGRRGGCGRGGLGDVKINNERPRVCVGRAAGGRGGAGLPARSPGAMVSGNLDARDGRTHFYLQPGYRRKQPA